MKKFLPIFLSLIICFSLVPSLNVEAAYTYFNLGESNYNFTSVFNSIENRKGDMYDYDFSTFTFSLEDSSSYYGVFIGQNYSLTDTRIIPYRVFVSSSPFRYVEGGITFDSPGKFWSFRTVILTPYGYRFQMLSNASSFGAGAFIPLNDPEVGIRHVIGTFSNSITPPPTSSEIGFLNNLKYQYNGSQVDFSWDELTSNDFEFDGVEVNHLATWSGLATRVTGKGFGVTDIGYTTHYSTQFPTRNILEQTVHSLTSWLTNNDVADNVLQINDALQYYFFRPYIIENGTKYYGQWISAYYDSSAGRFGVKNDPEVNEPLNNILINHNERYFTSTNYNTLEGDNNSVNTYDYSTNFNYTYNYYTYNNYYYDSSDLVDFDFSGILSFLTSLFNMLRKIIDVIFIPLAFLPTDVLNICKGLLVAAFVILFLKFINPFK